MPFHAPPESRRTQGFTLIELLLALVLVAVLGSLFLNAPRPVPAHLAGGTARRVRAMLGAALAEAARDGGDVEVRVGLEKDGDLRGRFIALALPAGGRVADVPGAEWLELVQGVAWTAAGAARDPAGAPTDGRIPGTVRCTAESCETGDLDYVVYYIGHVRAPRVAFAVVLTRDREVELFRWDARSDTWKGAIE